MNWPLITYLCIASQDELLVSNVLSALALRRYRPKVLGHARWLNFHALRFEQLQQLEATLIAPNHVQPDRPAAQHLRQAFLQRFFTLPGTYAYIGYDTLCFVGQQLHKHGVYFQKKLAKMPPTTASALAGFWYGPWHDNQQVTFLQLHNDATLISTLAPPTTPQDAAEHAST